MGRFVKAHALTLHQGAIKGLESGFEKILQDRANLGADVQRGGHAWLEKNAGLFRPSGRCKNTNLDKVEDAGLAIGTLLLQGIGADGGQLAVQDAVGRVIKGGQRVHR